MVQPFQQESAQSLLNNPNFVIPAQAGIHGATRESLFEGFPKLMVGSRLAPG
jgi:hypothetical protein